MPQIFARTMPGLLLCVCLLPAVAQAQASLETAIVDIRAGEYLRALTALNEIAKQSPGSPQIATVHAYRALAYSQMYQSERARAAAAMALLVDPRLVVGPPDFPPDVTAMFDRLSGLSASELRVFAGPATPVPAAAPPPVAAAAPVSSSTPAAPAAVPATAGTIYVYRPSNFVGSGSRMKIYCNGVLSAELQNGRFFAIKAAPGTWDLKVHNKEMKVAVEAGGEYYFRASVGGFGVNLKAETVEEGKAEVQNKKANDANRVFFQACKP